MPSHHQKCACKFLTENCQLSNSTQAQEESSIKATTFLALKLSRVDISSTPGATSCKMSPLKNAQCCCLETWSCNILEFMVKINIITENTASNCWCSHSWSCNICEKCKVKSLVINGFSQIYHRQQKMNLWLVCAPPAPGADHKKARQAPDV